MNTKRFFKPKLRIDAHHDIRASVDLFLTKLIEGTDPIYQSCLNCEHFNETKETCGLTNNQRPPARVIAYGCPKWEDVDEIPF